MPCFKCILRVNLSTEGGIKLTAATYFPLKCNVTCMKGPGSGASKNDFLLLLLLLFLLILLLLPVASARSIALLPAPYGPVEIKIQDVEVKCSSCCIVVPHTDAGTEPKVSHCASKCCSCRTLAQVVDAFSQHFFLGRRPDTLTLGWNTCSTNLAPKLEKGLGLQLCPCAWRYLEPRNQHIPTSSKWPVSLPQFQGGHSTSRPWVSWLRQVPLL